MTQSCLWGKKLIYLSNALVFLHFSKKISKANVMALLL